ncbi:MAG: LysR family transcriptional regulator [Betaproteobacteria bacterium]|nr:LysR family transcriptional regulator [Betaproteobacteria bacterium]
MRRLPPLPALRAFEAAARLGSFAAAASELNVTPSAISHQVRSLEAWFERLLFVRGTRRVELTPDGRRLLSGLTQAFDLMHDSCAVLRSPDQVRVLAVHCAPSFASKWLGPRIGRFMQAYPATTLRLTSGPEPPDLRRNTGIQLGITYGAPPERAAVEVQALGLEPTVPMCSPRIASTSEPITPQDVVRLRLIESKLNPVHWADWCRVNRVRLPPAARPSFDRGSMAIAAAVDGLGVVLESVRFAESELARGELVLLDGPGFRRIERETHFMCWRRAERDHPALSAFREWLVAQLATSPDGLST